MSEKITPLHPERERRRKRKRLALLLAVLAAVLGIVALVLFRQQLNLDRIRRFFTYFQVDETQYGHYAYEAHSNSAMAAWEDGLAIASVAGLDLYDEEGRLAATVSQVLAAPALETAGALAMAWDIGGSTLLVADSGGLVAEVTAERGLLDADLTESGRLCYAETADGYRTVLTVRDTERETFRWYSTTRYLHQCALSDDGAQLAAVALGQSGGTFESRLMLLDTAVEEQEALEASLGGQLIYQLAYMTADRLCAVGEDSLQFFDRQGTAVGTYGYDGSYLMGFSLGGSGYAALSLNPYQAGSRYTVTTVEADGAQRGSVYVGEEVLDVSAAGNYVAVLTPDWLRVYTSDMAPYAETDETHGASRVAMRADGTALLLGSSSAQLFLP